MKKCTTYTLGKTYVTKEYDPDPDTSYLGEYGSTFKYGKYNPDNNILCNANGEQIGTFRVLP